MNVETLRKDTPGCAMTMHFNNAGCSLPPHPVLQALTHYATLEATEGGYTVAAQQQKTICEFYTSAAQLIGAKPHQIAYAFGATHAFNTALSAIAFQQDDVIITSNEDYVSNQLTLLSLQKRIGIRLQRAKSLPEGGIDVEDVKRCIEQYHPKCVVLTHVPSYTGLIQPVEQVGELCRAKEIIYLVDACQSIGQLEVNVENIGCDFLVATFRKFMRGPRGAGFLYVSDRILNSQSAPLHIDLCGGKWETPNDYVLRKDAQRFEIWERSYAVMMASKVALAYLLDIGIDDVMKQNKTIVEHTRHRLQEANFLVLEQGIRQSNIITVYMRKCEPQQVLQKMRKRHINVSVVTQEQAQIGFPAGQSDGMIRISPHYYNTEEEVDNLVETLCQIDAVI